MLVNLRPLFMLHMGLISYATFYFIFVDELIGTQSNMGTYGISWRVKKKKNGREKWGKDQNFQFCNYRKAIFIISSQRSYDQQHTWECKQATYKYTQ